MNMLRDNTILLPAADVGKTAGCAVKPVTPGAEKAWTDRGRRAAGNPNCHKDAEALRLFPVERQCLEEVAVRWIFAFAGRAALIVAVGTSIADASGQTIDPRGIHVHGGTGSIELSRASVPAGRITFTVSASKHRTGI